MSDTISNILIVIGVLTLIELTIRGFKNIHKRRCSLSQDFEKSISNSIEINQKTAKTLKELENEIGDCIENYEVLKNDIKKSILKQQETLSVVLEQYTQLSIQYREALAFEDMCRYIYVNGYTEEMKNKFRELFGEQNDFVNRLEKENSHQIIENHQQIDDSISLV